MNVENAIEQAILKAGGNISREANQALKKWIRAATRKDYEKFADACARQLPLIEGNAEKYKLPPEQMAKNFDNLCRRLKIEPYDKSAFYIAPAYRRKLYWAAAAVIIVCITGAVYWLPDTPKSPEDPVIPVTAIPRHQAPVLRLDDSSNGVIELEGPDIATEAAPESDFIAMDLGDLSNLALHKDFITIEPGIETNMFRISSPANKRHKILLPDSSQIWLNAGSSLTFSIYYGDGLRKVYLDGEGFFDVKKGKTPFRVIARGAEIAVLGTRFNISCYQNEANTKITLLEGAVKVWSNVSGHLLAPGQQAVIGDTYAVHNVDTISATAWKQGLFNFSHAGIYEIFRELERWYNIEVTYNGPVPPDTFSLKASRKLKLEYMLLLLRKAGIKTEQAGKTVIVKR